jgi:hypothetical protein
MGIRDWAQSLVMGSQSGPMVPFIGSETPLGGILSKSKIYKSFVVFFF